MDEDLKITPASEIIFEDLGFSKAEAAILYAKTTLQIELEKEIKRRGLTQTAAAELLGVSRARLSRLMQGKLDKVSIAKLVGMCAQLDRRVVLKVTKRRKSAA